MTKKPRAKPLASEPSTEMPTPDDSPFPMPPLDPLGSGLRIDPDELAFELPAIEGLPFGKDGVEARAIRMVIERAERERAASRSS